MALHYLNNDSETKVSRNYSNPLPLQKTPFSIEDILYQRNHNSTAASSAGGGERKTSAMTNHQHISGFSTSANGQGKVSSSDQQQHNQQSGDRMEMRSSESEKSHKIQFSDRLMSGKSQGNSFVQPHSTGGHGTLSSSSAASSGHPGMSTYGGGNSVHSIYAQPTGPSYSDGYLHMIAPYLASTATGYKSVDPYFLSQGEGGKRR